MWRRPCDKEHEWPLVAENDPWLRANKKTGTLVLQPQGNEFYQQPVNSEEEPSLRGDPSPGGHLDFSPGRP